MKKMSSMIIAIAGSIAALLTIACPSPANPKTEITQYEIWIARSANGSVSADKEIAKAGETITLSIKPDEEYELEIIRVTSVSGLVNKLFINGSICTFTMPEEDVTIRASFVPVILQKYDIIIEETANGDIECGQSRAVPGNTVTVTLLPHDNYRYKNGSLTISPTVDDLIKISENAGGGCTWSFTMPEQTVNISAIFEETPVFLITILAAEHGTIIVGTDKARAGAVITIMAVPDSGYKLSDSELSITPADAVTLNRLNTQSGWTFTMAEMDIEIKAEFIELSPLEIYKGGARRGISAGALSDDNKYYKDSIEMESEETGHNGNHRAIKVSHAVNANNNAVQQSFGLFSDTEINLDNVAALSFWARANKQLNIRYAGFGDDDSNKRVVYTGEGFNQAISITTEWRRYIVPVPAPQNGQKTTRAFLFNAQIAKENYVCIDDIEFIESGVSLTAITIPDSAALPFYGDTVAAKLLAGADLKLTYTGSDGTITTLQASANSHTLKYDLGGWLTPFIEVQGAGSAFTVTVKAGSIRSNLMTVNIIDGILLDDFEGWGKINIPATPAIGSGYIWYTSASASLITRDYTAAVNNEIYSGLSAGSWRPAANANNPRGGRNFDAKDIRDYNTLVFHIRVTAGTSSSTDYQKNTVFTFELKNGGTLTNKTSGTFFTQQFTYNTDGWQEVKMKVADFINAGLDASAVTGYAFSVVDNKDAALRISFDDIAIIYE